jgi:4-alpha-glucanotransferase
MTSENHSGIPLAVHRTRDIEYRKPFGAVASGEYVELALDVNARYSRVFLCYAYGLRLFSYHEAMMDPDPDNPNRFHIRIRMPSDSGLFFYWFCMKGKLQDGQGYFEGSQRADTIIECPDAADVLYYVKSASDYTGEGRISNVPARIGADEERFPGAFQITVFRKDFLTPDWMKGALIYQIFPDRFARGSRFKREDMDIGNDDPARILHDHWDEEVDIDGKPETGYVACDFFGGTLTGIAEKTEYISALHTDLIYLNPIFRARSNHRYDTADYLAVDPLLGGEEGFSCFAEEMKSKDIKFILDGVFSHTGADSRYFNKYGRYPEQGAFQAVMNGRKSKYLSWYSFSKNRNGEIMYDSWWGFPELPNVNESDLFYREFILGNEGVLVYWLGKGAAGFRLDVSDELPDSFIREIRERVKEETGGEGAVLGEVWEDASCKVSYGTYRDFTFGNTHDSVMGYTFREAVIGYLGGTYTATESDNLLETYRENYPVQAYYCQMNLLSSHDVPRAITMLSGEKDPGDRRKQKDLRLSDEQRILGMQLMRLGFVFQLGYVGCPSVYYGDEIGMEGYRDPFNRRTYPWDIITAEQEEQLRFYREISGIRRELPVLKTGYYRTLLASEDLFVFERYLDSSGRDCFGKPCSGASRVIFAFNRSRTGTIAFSASTQTKEFKRCEVDASPEPVLQSGYRFPINVLEPDVPQILKPTSFKIFVQL